MFTFLLWCILFVLCWPLAPGAGSVSIRLAAVAAVPHCRRRGARSARDYFPRDHTAVPAAGGAVSNLSVKRSFAPQFLGNE
jgi:hypothetical protein